jgi:phosphopantetheinyl transferase
MRINTGTKLQQYLLHGLRALTDKKSMSFQAPKTFNQLRDENKQSSFLRLWMQKAPVPGSG